MGPRFAFARHALRAWRRLLADESGAIALSYALLFVPLIVSIGCAVDYARMVQYRSALQAAVDEAALAGAAAFTDPSEQSRAIGVATTYFNQAILPTSLSLTAPTVTANANGTTNGGATAHTVTVSATATVATTIMSMFTPWGTIGASATAGDPVVTTNMVVNHINWWACDGNTVYLYQVPKNRSGAGYDYASVPAFSVANGATQGNYYEIGTSYSAASPLGSLPPGQTMPSFSANQPVGVMLRNDTDGNAGIGCAAPVRGANSYGAPDGASQYFYSSLMLDNESPSQHTNYRYTTDVTRDANGKITQVTSYIPPNPLHPNGVDPEPIPTDQNYNNLWNYFGVNAPGTAYSNCTSTPLDSSTTRYQCKTQYPTTATSALSNCSLYVESGVTQDYLDGLKANSLSPSAAWYNCFSIPGSNSGNPQLSAPTCAQISALASPGANGAADTQPVAVFWWDDAGGVGPNEQFFFPQGSCSGTTRNGPGGGEDCLYMNNFFAMRCTLSSGGTGPGGTYTEVVLTQ